MKVVLIGYMASGKSSIGKMLAKDLYMEFIDLDDYIEAELNMSITAIFSEKGEIYFRKKESEILTKILSKKKSFILSTGGGTPCYGNNMKTILEKSTHSIYLQLPVSALIKRIEKEKQQRPLVKNIKNENLPEFIGKHLFERRQFYSQALHTIDCGHKDTDLLIEEIKELLF